MHLAKPVREDPVRRWFRASPKDLRAHFAHHGLTYRDIRLRLDRRWSVSTVKLALEESYDLLDAAYGEKFSEEAVGGYPGTVHHYAIDDCLPYLGEILAIDNFLASWGSCEEAGRRAYPLAAVQGLIFPEKDETLEQVRLAVLGRKVFHVKGEGSIPVETYYQEKSPLRSEFRDIGPIPGELLYRKGGPFGRSGFLVCGGLVLNVESEGSFPAVVTIGGKHEYNNPGHTVTPGHHRQGEPLARHPG